MDKNSGLVIAEESFDSWWPEGEKLSAAGLNEIGWAKAGKKFDLDVEETRQLYLSGLMKIYTARKFSVLIGEFIFSISTDSMEKGKLQAYQWGWYVLPGYGKVAKELGKFAIDHISPIVDEIILCSPILGRGKNLSRWAEKLGAIEVQRAYTLPGSR